MPEMLVVHPILCRHRLDDVVDAILSTLCLTTDADVVVPLVALDVVVEGHLFQLLDVEVLLVVL